MKLPQIIISCLINSLLLKIGGIDDNIILENIEENIYVSHGLLIVSTSMPLQLNSFYITGIFFILQ